MSLKLPFVLPLAEAKKTLTENGALSFVNVANSAARGFIVSEIIDQFGLGVVFWASEDEKADVLEPSVRRFCKGEVIHFQEGISATEYYHFLASLEKKTPTVVLFENFKEQNLAIYPSKASIEKSGLNLKLGATLSSFDFFRELEQIGYAPAADAYLGESEFRRQGDQIFISPVGEAFWLRIDLFGDEIEGLFQLEIPKVEEENDEDENSEKEKKNVKQKVKAMKKYKIRPADLEKIIGKKVRLTDLVDKKTSALVYDDLDEEVESGDMPQIKFTSFPKEEEPFFHLNFFSVLPYYTIPDWVTDMKERLRRGYQVVLMTKRGEELKNLMKDNNLMWTDDLTENAQSTINLVEMDSGGFLPHSFQNNLEKFILLTDRELWSRQSGIGVKKAISGMNAEMMTSLRPGDFVVHTDHGLARYAGMVRRELLEKVEKEYLELQYAGTDKLFLPVESAEKVTKFIGDDEPKLTRLDSSEWIKSQKKLKKETEEIAGELLKLFAKRELAKGQAFDESDTMMEEFVETFAYEPTPGQATAWYDVERDMESRKSMDRLVCGDVGFGKTEIAMRAAFKCFRSGGQCALIAPITILAEQHYESFMKRIEGKKYGVRLALLSRFQSPAEQKKIIENLNLGLVDIVIGTHRVLSKDVKFKNLRLVVIDEEQRFGVKQKEALKKMRANIDILTLTATPIPRTLNMGLAKLKDISTITTPPPGRLPVITEVRKYSPMLIHERIKFEVSRGGQVYFLHNQVKTIESEVSKLRQLLPNVSFVVAHGQLSPTDLEKRIKAFKQGEYQVLVASTIIENGIDLPNANTLIVNKAEKFGLSQLYQLRGRVGRSRTQAYAYFLYHKQKLSVDARKRLRAIVEASELGSGFQIAMRDLEIRGAGEILGANQSGAMKSVGVSHFMRILNQTVAKMKKGEISQDLEESEENINVELPLTAYIPGTYIPSTDEKIRTYQALAASRDRAHLRSLMSELRQSYGSLPREVKNLCKVIAIKLLLREMKLSGVSLRRWGQNKYQLTLRMGKGFTPDRLFGLIQHSPRTWVITAEAIKMTLQKLPITWYDDLVADVALLAQDKSKKKKNPSSKTEKA